MLSRIVTFVVAISASVLVAAGLPRPAAAAPPDPASDPFLQAPADLATLAPGTLIRQRPVSAKLVGALGLGLPFPGVSSYQLLVRSTDSKGRPAAVSATVLVPTRGATGQLLSYQPATDSLGAACEPSYTLRTGGEKEAAIMALATAKGLTVVVPDHQGPRHAYAAGRMAGHATLDAIRGAIGLKEAKLRGPETQVAMVGYSGGAIATGWAAQLQPGYAPELHLAGVASGGTPGDMRALYSAMDGSSLGGLFVAAVMGLAREYPELDTLLNDKGKALQAEIADECNGTLLLRHAFARIAPYTVAADPLDTPVGRAVVADNDMGTIAPTAPVMLWHSRFDQAIPYDSVVRLRQKWCGLGANVDLRTGPVSEHIVGAVLMVPEALPWLIDRLDGKPAPARC